jgi:AhpD family alkylhydroperoxidase
MTGSVDEFRAYRERMNDLILGSGNLTINRFFALDARAYEPGALDLVTKELLGLVASMVLRCDDCVRYHLDGCVRATDDELFEAFAVALIVGGSIVIPHLRRAVDFLMELREAGRRS